MAGYADDSGKSAIYEIRVKGVLSSELWAAWFSDMELRPGKENETLLVGTVIDQAALYGLLARLRDLALPLVSVRVLEPGSRT